jgi:hypothetical protein
VCLVPPLDLARAPSSEGGRRTLSPILSVIAGRCLVSNSAWRSHFRSVLLVTPSSCATEVTPPTRCRAPAGLCEQAHRPGTEVSGVPAQSYHDYTSLRCGQIRSSCPTTGGSQRPCLITEEQESYEAEVDARGSSTLPPAAHRVRLLNKPRGTTVDRLDAYGDHRDSHPAARIAHPRNDSSWSGASITPSVH